MIQNTTKPKDPRQTYSNWSTSDLCQESILLRISDVLEGLKGNKVLKDLSEKDPITLSESEIKSIQTEVSDVIAKTGEKPSHPVVKAELKTRKNWGLTYLKEKQKVISDQNLTNQNIKWAIISGGTPDVKAQPKLIDEIFRLFEEKEPKLKEYPHKK